MSTTHQDILISFVLAGKPGVLCLEGLTTDVDAYMKLAKPHSWGDTPSHQKVKRVYKRVFSGIEEITDLLGERNDQKAN